MTDRDSPGYVCVTDPTFHNGMFEEKLLADGMLSFWDAGLNGDQPTAQVGFVSAIPLVEYTVHFRKGDKLCLDSRKLRATKYKTKQLFECEADTMTASGLGIGNDQSVHIVMFGKLDGKMVRLVCDHGEVRFAVVRHPRKGELYC